MRAFHGNPNRIHTELTLFTHKAHNHKMFVFVVHYNPFLVYCRELAPGTVSLTGDRAQGDDSKHESHYKIFEAS